MLSDQNKALIARELGASDRVRLRDLEEISDTALHFLLDAARQEGRQSSGERVAALEAIVRRFVDADDEAPEFGVADCIDNKGEHYQSADYAALVHGARALLSPQAAPVEQGIPSLTVEFDRTTGNLKHPPEVGEIRMIEGSTCRFVEHDDKGYVWEVLGPANEQKDGAL